MSNQTEPSTADAHGTPPMPEHQWLHHLVGDWKVAHDMITPDGPMQMEGEESVRMLGELWAFGEGTVGGGMEYRTGMGFDVSSRTYRSFYIASMSSHLWNSVGKLSEDGKTMTMECEGPDMVHDGKTAMYRDVFTLQDEDHRTMESFFQDETGEWTSMMKAHYTRK